ncbi:uncharacterized protein LOC142172057 [Nicotiana tabacum]|uniref:Uncharacterized protein LOC142172057 n=1 Tax=Nicotiana tabacum TaxID=4097 RepID=A0AC58T3W5_TOBAC
MADQKHLTTELQFSAQFQSPANGQSGGIVVMWKDDLIKLEEVSTTPQGIHIMVKLASRGDFNEVLKARDKFGGNRISATRANHFWNCINKCNLIDLGFKGNKYTWNNKRYSNIHSPILERLDRCLATSDLIEMYPNASVSHLPRTYSDHCPLLISLYNVQTNHNRPFRFETMWYGHPDLPLIIHQSFSNNDKLAHATCEFQHSVLKWNKEVFGNTFHRKKHIMSRLVGIQKFPQFPFSRFLQNLDTHLQKEYSNILRCEEDFWKLKARIN